MFDFIYNYKHRKKILFYIIKIQATIYLLNCVELMTTFSSLFFNVELGLNRLMNRFALYHQNDTKMLTVYFIIYVNSKANKWRFIIYHCVLE
jgi:hypothetical protein